ncbi:GCN5-related N-acetyltransferase [Candidatus Sulfopaludibacter sp. SbA4]|nr:GCN5-related N-acetyltransferase [Candidatus Sulfopaludibacter sp. SbA4]
MDSSLAPRPQRITMEGRHVMLAPLDPAAHGDDLWEGTRGTENDALWQYLFDGPYPDRASFDAQMASNAASEDPLFFAILDRHSQRPLGWAAYMRIEPRHRVIEIGSILFTRVLQRSAGATEAMYLMARHVFEDLGYRRYEWKCNARNEPSRRAALRLGFNFEGIFRQHMIVKGRNRDTAWYSMLDREWPSRKAAFERWLAPSNFDGNGAQKVPLARLR